MLEFLVVERARGFHHFVERRSVTVGRPDLEAIFLVPAKCFRVGNQQLQACRGHRCAGHCNLGVQRIKQKLQRCESLLSINDGALLQIARRRGELLNQQALGLHEDGLRGSDLCIHVNQKRCQEPFVY